MNKALFDYIAASPTAYHATSHTAAILSEAGYTEISEHTAWKLEAGKGYYVTRNGSSLIAFRIPASGDIQSFMMTAAHDDTPGFKVKENAELSDGHYLRLSVERYGGVQYPSWLDRPLSIAGRVVVRTENGLASRLVDFGKTCAFIPNVALHMMNTNNGMNYNPAVDMVPLFGEASDAGSFRKRICEMIDVAEEDILTTDLFVYCNQEGIEWGNFISVPRLDDLQCAFASLTAFVESGKADVVTDSCPVFCLFDNEEVGSQTKQGAASTFLYDTLIRVGAAMGLSAGDVACKLASSFMVSCDNAHAVHPNHSEFKDGNHCTYMNQGIVIKYNASQKYTTDAISAAIFGLICERAGVPVQRFANRADMGGGSTLGNIANTRVSLNTIDIGLPQLAMHSAYETAGARDTEMMVRALTLFFNSTVCADGNGAYTLL